jgi:lysyl-tRNA synthetase class 2
VSGVSEEQMRERRIKKIDELMNAGIDPYPANFRNRITIRTVKFYTSSIPELIAIAGRVTSIRYHGKITFIDIADSTGSIEIHCKEENIGFICNSLATGDMIGIEGYKKNHPKDEHEFIEAIEITILSKVVRDLPNIIMNDDFRFRHREVEMAINKQTRDLFILRSNIIKSIRNFLELSGYLEVETPILQPVYGGATARPFVTHHNALSENFYLRISSELYLKRYLVGGFDKVFHIGKVFRNEGISINHSPEFSMVEFFATCVDHREMKVFTQQLIEHVFYSCNDSDKIPDLNFVGSLSSDDWPLSRKSKDNPDISEAWELYIDGVEIASGANDLNDPLEQAKRWNEGTSNRVVDENNKDEIFEEANPYDKSYIESLEYGMLPTAGVGIGIDRLVMLLTKSKSIREVTAFPTMR